MSGRDTDLIANNDPQTAWAMVQTLPMEFKPNAQFSYNQTGYVILGKIINKLAEQPFTDFIKQHQLAKIGMPLTEQAGFAYFEEVIPNQSSYYRYGRDGSLRTAFGELSPIMRTAAGMNTNAKKLALYITALQKGELLNKSSLAALWDPIVLNHGRTAGFSMFENGYAIGWQVENRKQHRAVSSSGANANTLIFYPDDNLSIIVLTNLLGALPIQFVDEIASIYLPDMKKENGWQSPFERLNEVAVQHQYNNIGEVIAKVESEIGVHFDVDNINAWGYNLVGQDNLQDALTIFKFNVEMHPNNANAFDSLGETYGALKQYKKALVNYQQVLKLQPDNQSAKEIIKKIKQVMQ
ncbi:MAG: class A beta-lactamase-related serine hydrolase [Algicola sp.]|nr:class A beta-lactamase-related serine hydrolase [Algicola sp.]